MGGLALVALVLKFLMKKFRVVAPSPNAADQGIQMGDVPNGATLAREASRIIQVQERSSGSSGGGGRH